MNRTCPSCRGTIEGQASTCPTCLADLPATFRQEHADVDLSGILLTTGDLREPYEVLDCVFAMDSHEAGYWMSFFGERANPSHAFERVKGILKRQCWDLGG